MSNGKVRFLSNGTPIGSGTINAAGIATIQWRLRGRQLATYRQLTGDLPRKLGAIQAVFERSAGRPATVSSSGSSPISETGRRGPARPGPANR